MKSRAEKLKQLQLKKKSTKNNDLHNYAVQFKQLLDELKETLGVSISVDTTELVNELKKIDSFSDTVSNLETAVSNFKIDIPQIPETVELTGYEKLVSVLKENTSATNGIPKTITLDNLESIEKLVSVLSNLDVPKTLKVDNIDDIQKSVTAGIEAGLKSTPTPKAEIKIVDNEQTTKFIKAVESLKLETTSTIEALCKGLSELIAKVNVETYKGKQDASEYIPVRRVRKVGQRLVYDDDDWASRSGGGGTPLPTVMVDGNQVVLISNPNERPTNKYKYHGDSLTATYEYAFYEDKDGNWYIQRETLSTGYLEFAKGTGGIGSVYTDSTSDPSGTPTFDTYANTFN